MKSFLSRILTFDPRSLALFRILIGLVIFVDIAFIQSSDILTFYSDQGLLPRAALLGDFLVYPHFSFLTMNGTVTFQYAAFFIIGLVTLSFIVGWHTHISSILLWVLIISMHSRNEMMIQGGDVFLREVLFWAMFLPLGKTWSLDSIIHPREDASKPYTSFFCLTFLLQVVLVYGFTVIFKIGDVWFKDFSAVYYALQLDQFATPIGLWVRAHFPLPYLQILTAMSLFAEIFFPLCLLFPLFNGWLRTIGVFGLIALHFSFGVFLTVGVFPWICIGVMCTFLPPSFWNLFPRLYAVDSWFLQTGQKILHKVSFFYYEEKQVPKVLQYSKIPVGIFCFILVIWYNLNTIHVKFEMEPHLKQITQFLRLDQRWNMFAPSPSREDGWFVIVAKLKDGRVFDMMPHLTDFDFPKTFTTEEKLLNGPKPNNIYAQFKNDRWRKYLTNIYLSEFEKHRLYFGRYITSEWNNKRYTGNDQLAEFWIYLRFELTPVLPETKTEVHNMILWHHWCFDKTAEAIQPAPSEQQLPAKQP